MKKTEYRIIPLRTIFGDMYLQFKSIEVTKSIFGKVEEKEVWRFVPEELYSYVMGEFLTEQDCPTSMSESDYSRFKHCFHKQEGFELYPFTRNYENIDDYFIHLAKKREEYLNKQSEAKNAEIIYL